MTKSLRFRKKNIVKILCSTDNSLLRFRRNVWPSIRKHVAHYKAFLFPRKSGRFILAGEIASVILAFAILLPKIVGLALRSRAIIRSNFHYRDRPSTIRRQQSPACAFIVVRLCISHANDISGDYPQSPSNNSRNDRNHFRATIEFDFNANEMPSAKSPSRF